MPPLYWVSTGLNSTLSFCIHQQNTLTDPSNSSCNPCSSQLNTLQHNKFFWILLPFLTISNSSHIMGDLLRFIVLWQTTLISFTHKTLTKCIQQYKLLFLLPATHPGVWNCYIPLHCCFLNLQVSLLYSQGQIFAETTQLAASCITMEAIRFKFQQSVKYCRYCAIWTYRYHWLLRNTMSKYCKILCTIWTYSCHWLWETPCPTSKHMHLIYYAPLSHHYEKELLTKTVMEWSEEMTQDQLL